MRELSHRARKRRLSGPRVAKRRVAKRRVGKPRVGKPRVGKPRVGKPRVGKPRVGKGTRVQDLIARSARRLRRARVFFGHGTDNAWDEAATLVLHALALSHDAGRAVPLSHDAGRAVPLSHDAGRAVPLSHDAGRAVPLAHGAGRTAPLSRDVGAAVYGRRVSAAAERCAGALITRRIKERVPAVYLTSETRFAGLPIHVDPRVLIPRSAVAELIERRFAPWIAPVRVRRILDLGTGSGCIAVACAKAFPRARVDAADISKDALEVAGINVRRHRLTRRVRLVESDHFNGLGGETYDIIVSNPPYVGARELRALPPEYRHEPRVALAAGASGLDSVRVILREAGRHLRPDGLLVVEVGNTEAAVRRSFRRLPFIWLDFERGGGGVFLLTGGQLHAP